MSQMSFSCLAPPCSSIVQDIWEVNDKISRGKKKQQPVYSPIVPNNGDEKSGDKERKEG